MPRGLDHIVHAVRDLDAAAALYRRLGFTVGARNRHPWGTENHIVQFPGVFIELLTVAEPDKLGADAISVLFGATTRRFLSRREGLSFLVLESLDAAADLEAFRISGISGADEVATFGREAKRPDGTTVKVGFSLAFAQDAKAPEIGFFTCQQHHPENFWNPAFQQHVNTATGVAGIILVADNPSDHHIFLSAFVGKRELLATSSGLTVKTPRGEIQVMTPTAFRSHFGMPAPGIANGAKLAAVRLPVRSLAPVRELLAKAGFAPVENQGAPARIVVPPEQAMGAMLVFEA
jgi:catechol 2,3-dioxygenase-like lactoylglutathione lyase family enzyme